MLTTTRDMAALAASSFPLPDTTWHVGLDETFSQKLAVPGITSVVAWGQAQSATIVLPLRQKQ